MHLRGITLTSRYLTKDGTSILRALRVHDSLNNCEMRRNVILHRDFNQITNGKANVPCCRRAESKFRLVERVRQRRMERGYNGVQLGY